MDIFRIKYNFRSDFMINVKNYIKDIYEKVISKNPSEPEFHQAVHEILFSLEPVLNQIDSFNLE